MIKLKVGKSKAKGYVERWIYEGQLRSENLSAGDYTYEKLSNIKEEHTEWSEEVISILGRMFSDKSKANEFQHISVISSDENDSHLDERNRLVSTINEQARWLTSLAESINEFPQAHNTPIGSLGR